MTRGSFIARFIVMLVIQLILTKFVQIGPYILINVLPAVILCIPTARQDWWTLVVAFLSGLAVDGLADGPLGLNAAALLIVALVRKTLISLLIDDELVERHYNFSFHSNGFVKITNAVAASVVLFLAVYVILDSAGTRSFWFNSIKILVSSATSIVFSLPVIEFLSPYQRR